MNDEQITKEINSFVSGNMEKWINDTILKETIRSAQAANLPDEFISHIKIEQNENGFLLVNDWIKDDKPLAIYFNYGTVDHYIKPKNKKALHGGDKWPYFSKGHYVSGLPKTEAMENGLQIGKKKLENKIKSETKKFSRTLETKYKVKVKVR